MHIYFTLLVTRTSVPFSEINKKKEMLPILHKLSLKELEVDHRRSNQECMLEGTENILMINQAVNLS